MTFPLNSMTTHRNQLQFDRNINDSKIVFGGDCFDQFASDFDDHSTEFDDHYAEFDDNSTEFDDH